MKKLLIFILFPCVAFSQHCDCTENFEWVKKTIEENDAGFQFAINKKSKEVYGQHNALFLEKIAKIDNTSDCLKALSQWLTFFRSEHLSIRRIHQEQSQSKKNLNHQEIINSYKDWEKIRINIKAFQNQLKTKEKNDFEGIWESGSYTIGIKKIDTEYVGFIIEGDGIYWTKGQIKLRIKDDLSAIYYMQDHSEEEFTKVELFGNKYIEMGFITLKRVFPKLKPDPEIERYFKSITSQNPFFEKINSKTSLIRIPRFWSSQKNKIDSVINSNKEKILKTENLIIDLRNNGGGSDTSYQELLPFLYTNPIRTVGVAYLSTPLNNQRMLDFINKAEYGFDEEGKKWAKQSYDTLSKHIGEFINLNEHYISETTFENVHDFPENIGIIINENNGSTTEQFLLAAKQSKKVKLFGTTTAGVLDISNMYFVKAPYNEFELGYSLTKSLRIPEMTIDDKGIQPDYYIDSDIPKYHWIQFVTKILNE